MNNNNDKNIYPFKGAKLHNYNNALEKKWYVEFWAWSVDEGRLKRKRMFQVNKLKTVEERWSFAKKQMSEINKLLRNGYFFDEKIRKENIINELVKDNKIRLSIEDELIRIYENKKNAYRQKTNEATKTIINRFVKYCNTLNKNLTIDEIDGHIAIGFQKYLLEQKKLANVTVNKTIAYVKKFFNEFLKTERIQKNPFDIVDGLPILESKKNKAFNDEQIYVLKNYIVKHDLQLWNFIQFMFWCYLRPKEIRELQVKHILLKEKKIYVPADVSKNKKSAYLLISDKLFDVIREMGLDYSKTNFYVFSGKSYCGGKMLGKNNMYNRFKRILQKNGIGKDYTLYSWKHTGVVKAYRSGIDIKAIQLQCRHHSIAMTDRYLKSLGFIDNYCFMKKINDVEL